MNKKKYLVVLVSIGIFSYFLTGLKAEQPAEDLEVVVGFGGDIDEKGKTDYMYVAPSSVYTFEESQIISSDERIGYGKTPAETRENRQLISNKQFILGLEKVYLIGKPLAKLGLIIPLEIFFRNSYTNDNGFLAISDKSPKEIFNIKIKGYPSSADYIDGMIKNAVNYNFFSQKYKLSDAFINLATEGKNLVVPLIDVEEGDPKIAGLCIFKKDKMIGNLDTNETKTFNMLSDTEGKGVISIVQNAAKHLDFYGKVKRNVKVYKLNNKYKYEIGLKFTGDIVSDTIYSRYMNKAKINNEIQKKLEMEIKKKCDSFITYFQEQYAVDSLQLGQYAVAKYGRDTGTDWDEIFANADIEINVKVKIDRIGRGNYYIEQQSNKE